MRKYKVLIYLLLALFGASSFGNTENYSMYIGYIYNDDPVHTYRIRMVRTDNAKEICSFDEMIPPKKRAIINRKTCTFFSDHAGDPGGVFRSFFTLTQYRSSEEIKAAQQKAQAQADKEKKDMQDKGIPITSDNMPRPQTVSSILSENKIDFEAGIGYGSAREMGIKFIKSGVTAHRTGGIVEGTDWQALLFLKITDKGGIEASMWNADFVKIDE